MLWVEALFGAQGQHRIGGGGTSRWNQTGENSRILASCATAAEKSASSRIRLAIIVSTLLGDKARSSPFRSTSARHVFYNLLRLQRTDCPETASHVHRRTLFAPGYPDGRGCPRTGYLDITRIQGCTKRGGVNSLMAEVLEDHVRLHLLSPEKKTEDPRELAEDMIELVRAYLKWRLLLVA